MQAMHRAIASVVVSAVMAASANAQFEQNRIDLNAIGDILWFLNDPYMTGDPANGDYDGDSYYRVMPGYALQSNPNSDVPALLVGHGYALYDGDWTNDATIPFMTFDEAMDTGSGELAGDPYGGVPYAFPEIVGTGFPLPSTCPSPGFVTGFDVRETFLDTAGQQAPLSLVVNDTDDHWAFTGYMPGANATGSGSPTVPNPNSCGGSGDATFPWLASTDEQQVDYLGTTTSAYGGFQVGTGTTSGVNAFTPDGLADGMDTSWHFNQPIVQINASVDVTGGGLSPLLPDLAGLNPYIGLTTGGIPSGSGPELGFIYSDGTQHSVSGDGVTASLGLMNLGPTLQDMGVGCIPLHLTCLALNPGDPIFASAILVFGLNGFADQGFGGDPDLDEAISTSNTVPITPGPALIDATLKIQVFTLDIGSGLLVNGSQVMRFTFRAIP